MIGVGEATTPPIVAFLHGYLGIDPAELFARVRPTWKLGIRFEWGLPERAFHYAFGGGDLGACDDDPTLLQRILQKGWVVTTTDAMRAIAPLRRVKSG